MFEAQCNVMFGVWVFLDHLGWLNLLIEFEVLLH